MNKKIWDFIQLSIKNNERFALLLVVASQGSSPGRAGFWMVVTENKKMEGSIGGGIMEHKLVELALDKIKTKDERIIIKKQIHQEGMKNNRSGMICSGEQTVLIHPSMHTEKALVKTILDRIKTNTPTLLKINKNGFSLCTPSSKEPQNYFDELKWEYGETISSQNNAYVIGAGHVGMAMTQLLKMLGFFVILLDDRANLNTFVSNEFADEKHQIDYSTIGSIIPEGSHTYVILMSFGYRTDELIARQLIPKNVAYFGIMGSKHKMKTMWENLIKDGFSKDDLDNVHTPIGLQIGSKTPMEIAVSIAAEIINIKNSREK